VYHANRLVMF